METFRSEYSEDGLSTSRFGASGSTSSLSFTSRSGSSFDSRSARSDFLSSYEQKFLARKAEKKKKKEREVTNNQVSSAEEKWKTDREAEREIRKREMETWIPTPAALKRIERDSKKRNRERMKSVLDWYPSSEGAENEVRPLFAVVTESKKEQPVHSEQQRAADEAQRNNVAVGLQRQVADLKMKVSYVERQVLSATEKSSPMKLTRQKKNNLMRKRRPGREQLAPLHDVDDGDEYGENSSALARSASHSSIGARYAQPPAASTAAGAFRNCVTANLGSSRISSSLGGSRSATQLAAVDEDAADDAEMQQFLLLHRRQVRTLSY